jgi:large subunit ribosomal protein L22e
MCTRCSKFSRGDSSSQGHLLIARPFVQFIINASQPASDKIFDVSAFEKFLHDKIKVDNRVGNLGDTIAISQQGDGKIEVIAHTQFSGRYLKYL